MKTPRVIHRHDTVIDRTGKKERKGRVTGFTDVRGELYVQIRFEDQKMGEEPEQYEDVFFAKDHGGRWDEVDKCWMMERMGDELPDTDPFVISFNKSIEKMNLKILLDSIPQEDKEYNLLQLDIVALNNEQEADNLGSRHPYYNHYKYQGEKYRRYIHYRITGKLLEVYCT